MKLAPAKEEVKGARRNVRKERWLVKLGDDLTPEVIREAPEAKNMPEIEEGSCEDGNARFSFVDSETRQALLGQGFSAARFVRMASQRREISPICPAVRRWESIPCLPNFGLATVRDHSFLLRMSTQCGTFPMALLLIQDI